MSKYYGESERLLGSVFSLANDLPEGGIIFLDEVHMMILVAYTLKQLQNLLNILPVCMCVHACCYRWILLLLLETVKFMKLHEESCQ
jgi:hypothetical protein